MELSEKHVAKERAGKLRKVEYVEWFYTGDSYIEEEIETIDEGTQVIHRANPTKEKREGYFLDWLNIGGDQESVGIIEHDDGSVNSVNPVDIKFLGNRFSNLRKVQIRDAEGKSEVGYFHQFVSYSIMAHGIIELEDGKIRIVELSYMKFLD